MTNYTPKQFKLKDGTEIEVREMKDVDLELSLDFFKTINEEERLYLRMDVTKRENVKKRIQQMKSGLVHRLVATYKDKIIADGALELSQHGWEEHVGEMRIIIADYFQRKGLGMIMARELYYLAASAKLEEIVVRMMRTQDAAKNIFRKLGFHEEVLLPDHVKDLTGKSQDLIIMRCYMKELWQELEDYFSDMRMHR
ncbi:GNAT family N-acetyltransferase [candidate division CSSED10-310 bacterium]|uniref:GNAT family N-acetyltransferase n=1 Tax=candidate division CSSED10-310 bacterium TaxID=2855610 RepID=A0ABV6YZ45_UNCC1